MTTDRFITTFFVILLVMWLLSLAAHAQTFPSGSSSNPCHGIEDEFEITDRGEYAAEVRYLNSGVMIGGHIQGCTSFVPDELTAPNGITVKINVMVGSVDNDNAERITVTPVNPEFQAIPPQSWVLDGDETTILITRAHDVSFKPKHKFAGMDWWVCSYWVIEDEILREYGLTLPATDPEQIEEDHNKYGHCGVKVIGKYIGHIE